MKSLIACAARMRRARHAALQPRPGGAPRALSVSYSLSRAAAHKACALLMACALLVSTCPSAALALDTSPSPAMPPSPAENTAETISTYDDPLPSADFQVSCAIYGPDLSGVSVPWAARSTFTVQNGTTAAELTRMLIAQAQLNADAQQTQYGFYLSSITSPFTGAALGWDAATGKYWQLFVNGTVSAVGADQVALKEHDAIVWSYAGDGEDAPIIQPDIHEGDIPTGYPSAWAGFTSANKCGAVVTKGKTPTQAAQAAWIFDPFKDSPATGNYDMRGVSDPLIVGASEDIYMLAGSTIFKIDATSATIKTSKPTGFPANYYFSRPAYHAGLIFAAADDGRVAAFAADTLDRVWCSNELPAPANDQRYQNLSSITVAQGKVYAAFTVVGEAGASNSGTMVCVDERSGNVLWTATETAHDGTGAGYYWAGACPSGTDIVIADDSGQVKLINGNTGAVKASLSIGSASRSGVIALEDVDVQGNGTYLAVSRNDGVLHKVLRQGNTLSEQGAVSFAATSTSTPAVAGGKAFVCGCDTQNYGTLSVIDLATMTLEKTVRGSLGAAQSSPLLSVQGSDIYAYFTCNNLPGAAYSYKLGDAQAKVIFTPQESDQQYCTASLIADSGGNLYYSNDSKKLFKLVGDAVSSDSEKREDTKTRPEANTEPTNEKGDKSDKGDKNASKSPNNTDKNNKRNDNGARTDGLTMPTLSVPSTQSTDVEENTPRFSAREREQISARPQSRALSTEANTADGSDDASPREFPRLALVGIGVAVVALGAAAIGLYRRSRL